MSPSFLGENPHRTIADARRLADDLDRLLSHGQPSDADLAGAPIIDCWQSALRPQRALVGVVTGHPSIGPGRPAVTSALYAFDPVAGWARTWSRFYRVGRPVDLPDGRRQ
jgi:hypothetical protein